MRTLVLGLFLLAAVLATAGLLDRGEQGACDARLGPVELHPTRGPPPTSGASEPVLQGRRAHVRPERASREEPPVDLDAEFRALDGPVEFRAWSLRELRFPPDPLPHGTGRLTLHFVDARTKEPVPTAWRLWHLDAPASAQWTRGDQLRAGSEDRLRTAVVEGLPDGTYRVVATAEGPLDEGAPAFTVTGGESEVWVEILTPRSFRVRLKVFDHEGVLLPAGEVNPAWIQSGTVNEPSTPSWATPRRVKADGRVFEEETSCHWDGGGESWTPVAVDEDGFLTDDTWREAHRHEQTGTIARYRFEGRSVVHVSVDHEGLHDRTCVAIAAPLSWIRARIRHADGRPLGEGDEGLTVEAWCEAEILATDYVDPDAWRGLRIAVRIEADGKSVAGGYLSPGEPDCAVVLPR